MILINYLKKQKQKKLFAGCSAASTEHILIGFREMLCDAARMASHDRLRLSHPVEKYHWRTSLSCGDLRDSAQFKTGRPHNTINSTFFQTAISFN